jgi:hypothetical protein
MHPITFVKNHPMATAVTFIAGMAVGPWLLSMVSDKTGFSLGVPSYGGGGE